MFSIWLLCPEFHTLATVFLFLSVQLTSSEIESWPRTPFFSSDPPAYEWCSSSPTLFHHHSLFYHHRFNGNCQLHHSLNEKDFAFLLIAIYYLFGFDYCYLKKNYPENVFKTYETKAYSILNIVQPKYIKPFCKVEGSFGIPCPIFILTLSSHPLKTNLWNIC